MKAGDILGTGTISGPTDSSLGSMLELSWKGSREVPLSQGPGSNAVGRKFLEDGDTVSFSGYAEIKSSEAGSEQGAGAAGVAGGAVRSYRIGFGSVSGKILPALPAASFTAPLPVKAQSAPSAPPKYTDFRLYSYWRSTCSWRYGVGSLLVLALNECTYSSQLRMPCLSFNYFIIFDIRIPPSSSSSSIYLQIMSRLLSSHRVQSACSPCIEGHTVRVHSH